MPKLFVKQYSLCWTPAFFFWQSRILVCFSKRSIDHTAAKISGTEFLMSFPGRQPFTCVITVTAKCIPCDFIERDKLEAVSGFLQTVPYMPFPFADLVLYPFTVIRHSYGNDYMLSTVSLSESLSLGDTLNTSIIKALCSTWNGIIKLEGILYKLNLYTKIMKQPHTKTKQYEEYS